MHRHYTFAVNILSSDVARYVLRHFSLNAVRNWPRPELINSHGVENLTRSSATTEGLHDALC